MINEYHATQRPMLPADAFPVAIYSTNQRLTVDMIHVDSTGHGVSLWIGGTMISVGGEPSDLQLHAALVAARKIEQESRRFGQILADQLEARRLRRIADEQEAAFRAAAHVQHTPAGEEDRPEAAAPAGRP